MCVFCRGHQERNKGLCVAGDVVFPPLPRQSAGICLKPTSRCTPNTPRPTSPGPHPHPPAPHTHHEHGCAAQSEVAAPHRRRRPDGEARVAALPHPFHNARQACVRGARGGMGQGGDGQSQVLTFFAFLEPLRTHASPDPWLSPLFFDEGSRSGPGLKGRRGCNACSPDKGRIAARPGSWTYPSTCTHGHAPLPHILTL